MASRQPSTTAVRTEASAFLLTVSFVEGGCVMAVELVGAKMIEPFFGASLYVWSSVLAITLVGLTAGYYTGGVVSERYPHPRTLYLLLTTASAFVAVMPALAQWIMRLTLSLDFRVAAILSALVFIFPPLTCLGMVSPIIIRKLSEHVETAGRKAGLVYAISTVGGILTTFLVGFYFIPEIGLRITAAIVAGLLVVFPVIYFFGRRRILGLAVSVALVVLAIVATTTAQTARSDSAFFRVVYRSEGLLGQVAVVDYLKDDTRALFVNNISQSYMHIPTGRSQWSYVHRLATYSAFKPRGSRVFLAGLGAGLVVNELHGLGFEVDVCDIDRRMADVARQYFAMTADAHVMIDDARHAIRGGKEELYDIVILDISAGERQPTNLYTVEGFLDIQRILKDDGVLLIHYPAIYNGIAGRALKSVGQTLIAAGFHVQMVNTNPDRDKLAQYIFFAAKDGTRLEDQSFERRDPFSLPYGFPVGAEAVLPAVDFADGEVLTDDRPQMDKLHQRVAAQSRSLSIQGVVTPLLNEGVRMF